MANDKVLIVDDDDDAVLVIRLPLEATGYSVFRAASSDEGLRMIKEVNPDLILLDVMMDATTSGLQMSRKLRNPDPESEYAAYRNVPILMITALPAASLRRLAPDQKYLPIDAFIEKPIDPDALLDRVRECLAKKSA